MVEHSEAARPSPRAIFSCNLFLPEPHRLPAFRTPALTALVRGQLAPAQTWETRLTQAGAEAENAAEAATAKSDAWAALVRERKLGYLALLRNVRNILTHAPATVGELCEQLANETAVRRSLVYATRRRSTPASIAASSASPCDL